MDDERKDHPPERHAPEESYHFDSRDGFNFGGLQREAADITLIFSPLVKSFRLATFS